MAMNRYDSVLETQVLAAAASYRQALSEGGDAHGARAELLAEARAWYDIRGGRRPPKEDTPEAAVLRAAIRYGAGEAHQDVLADRLAEAAEALGEGA